VTISVDALAVDEKSLRNHEMQVVLGPCHRYIEQATFFFHFLASAGG
jgi:hypothetical protein